jgi:hypothetical protein
MPYERTGYAPWSLTREAGVQSATVDGTIQVPQYGQPIIDIGFIDEKGNWQGRKSSDETFTIDDTHSAVANGAAILSPQTANRDFIDMTGYSNIFIAIKPSNGGNFAIAAVMGPDSNPFANLTPVRAAVNLGGNIAQSTPVDIEDLFLESAQSLGADVWNIYYISSNLANQKNMQFKITNNTGGSSDIDFAYLRAV